MTTGSKNEHPLNINVEVPQPWLDSERDGARNRDMFTALKSTLVKTGHNCHFEPISFGTDFRHKYAPKEGFSLSYHSCGDARHVWRLKETSIPNFYSFDRLGFSGWSEIAQLPERYENPVEATSTSDALDFVRQLATWLKTNNLSKYKQPLNNFDLQEPFVFFPLQVRGDIVSRFCRLDPLRVLHYAARNAKSRKVPLVIKRHPYCKNPIVAASLALESATNPYLIITEASVQQILPACATVLVANSGVGLEALIHEKPVYAFALSEYEAFVSSINYLADIDRVFDFHIDYSSHIAKSSRFIHFFLKHMCFDARDSKSIRQRIGLAEHCAREDIWCEQPLWTLATDQ